MNLVGLSRVCCPKCEGGLDLEALKSRTVEIDAKHLPADYATRAHDDPSFKEQLQTQIEEGLLSCSRCKAWFPIVNFVPLLLVFSTALHEQFAKTHAASLSRLAGFTPPRWAPRPGEQSIQRTFTEEWAVVEDNEYTFAYTTDELAKLQSEVWFNSTSALNGVKRILDIGCGGYAAEAEALRLNFPDAEVCAVDLNLHVLRNGHRFIDKPAMHVVIASLFDIPFRRQAFDLVFSQGVLHHTYSTYDALKNASTYAPIGSHLFVWLYAIEDHQVSSGFKGFRERVKYYLLMVGLRPIVSASPRPIRAAMVHAISVYGYVRYKLSRGPKKAGWKFKNVVHATYDYVTPKYAHVHGFNEVMEWFEGLGFEYALHSPAKYRQLFNRRLEGVGVLGKRVR